MAGTETSIGESVSPSTVPDADGDATGTETRAAAEGKWEAVAAGDTVV